MFDIFVDSSLASLLKNTSISDKTPIMDGGQGQNAMVYVDEYETQRAYESLSPHHSIHCYAPQPATIKNHQQNILQSITNQSNALSSRIERVETLAETLERELNILKEKTKLLREEKETLDKYASRLQNECRFFYSITCDTFSSGPMIRTGDHTTSPDLDLYGDSQIYSQGLLNDPATEYVSDESSPGILMMEFPTPIENLCDQYSMLWEDMRIIPPQVDNSTFDILQPNYTQHKVCGPSNL